VFSQRLTCPLKTKPSFLSWRIITRATVSRSTTI
jgi:hypothetical protein